jgi:hypothetical protein
MSSSTYDDSGDPPQDEETPLLSSVPISEPVTKDLVTPVPWAQLWVLLVLQLAEPLTSQGIYPFVPEVLYFSRYIIICFFSPAVQFARNVGITHGDESRVGYYVGLLVCLIGYPPHTPYNII